jgi:pyruvate formate lyase activating enzyme
LTGLPNMVTDKTVLLNNKTVEPDTGVIDASRDSKGMILHLQRFSTDDGPGIRTTVFFKGCPLSCMWCHNPESISIKPQIQWLENRCINCGTCIKTCPKNCLTKAEQGIIIDRKLCDGCGDCAENCPANAMELLGKKVTSDALFNELIKDRIFFEKSGGGVTLSGGEPLLQPDFSATLLNRLKGKEVNTAIDTCGLCSTAAIDKVLPLTDVVLFDLKEINSEKHRAFTGQHNQKILDNLLYIRDYILNEAQEKVLWIRSPLIPGATATPENIFELGAFIAKNLAGVAKRWELCAFNNLCRDKYRRLGIAWEYAGTPLMTKEMVGELEQCAKRSGVNSEIVFATGPTKIEDS